MMMMMMVNRVVFSETGPWIEFTRRNSPSTSQGRLGNSVCRRLSFQRRSSRKRLLHARFRVGFMELYRERVNVRFRHNPFCLWNCGE